MTGFFIAATIAAMLATLSFALYYNSYRWEKSPEGRNVMALALSLFLLEVPLLVFLLTNPEIWEVLNNNPGSVLTGSLANFSISGVMAWRTFQVMRAHKPKTDASITTEEEEK